MSGPAMEPIRVRDIIAVLEAWAPQELAESWDAVGLQVGHPEQHVRRVLVAMDLDDAVMDEAERWGAQLVVTHHPLMFRPLSSLRGDRPQGALLYRLVRHEISLYTAHTNLDRAPGGVNDVLAAALGLVQTQTLCPIDNEADSKHPENSSRQGAPGLGRWGFLPEPMTLAELTAKVKRTLDTPFVLVSGDPSTRCTRVAVCGGSGGGFVSDAIRVGVDVFVTGDVKYHQVQEAAAHGLSLIDPGHFASEKPVLEAVCRRIAGAFPGRLEVRVAERSRTFRTFWRVE